MSRVKSPYIIPIFISHLGCPFQCVYCQQERITGQEKWLPTAEEISNRIEKFLSTRKPNKYSHTEVAFYGGTFTGLPQKLIEEMLQAAFSFVQKGEIDSLRASTKPDYIFPDQLLLLKQYQMTTIELGVQSLDDQVLKKVGRGYGPSEVFGAVENLKKAGFKVGIQLMPALPGASEEEAFETAEKSIALQPDFVRIYPTVVLEGTGLAALYRQGVYQPWNLEQAIRVCRRLQAMFSEANIPIIKMGLEFSTDERSGILAGPYHPNFRQLVGK